MFEYYVLLVCIFTVYPPVLPIVLFLKQKAPAPSVLGDATLPVKPVLFLPDVDTAFCLFEKSKSS